MSKPSFSKEDLEALNDTLYDFLCEEGFIEGDDEDWEPFISKTAKAIYAFYDREPK